MLTAAQVQASIEADEARIRELTIRRGHTAPFIDFQPAFVPGSERRPDLSSIFGVFERAYQAACGNGRPIIALVSAPPQVGKTQAGQAACAAWLARRPTDWLGYVTYQSKLAETKSRDVRDIALRAGVGIRGDSSAVDRWQTTSGGGFLARGLDGALTGQSGLMLLWVDDPYAGRHEAESQAVSAHINETVSGVVMTRRHPRTSVIISHTRWTTTDLITTIDAKLRGKIEALGVDLLIVNLPCVSEDGEPLITFGGRDRQFYAAQRLIVTEHDWWSLYMGAPRPREGKLFRGVHVYKSLPARYQVCIGVDLAYTTKTSGDWSVAVVLARDLDTAEGERPTFYVLAVVRRRCSVEEWFRIELAGLAREFPGAPMWMRTGGQESALVETAVRAHGVHVHTEPTRGDKLSNASVLADDWCKGRVLVPSAGEWVGGFTGRMLDLSGMGDEVDDEMDALTTAHKRLSEGVAVGKLAMPAGRLPAARGGWM